MTDFALPGFRTERLPGTDGVTLCADVGGTGDAVVLLHGFPQTRRMWRHVAGELADTFTVVVPDLRGYGDSDKPAADGPDTYSKRAMAQDVVAALAALGHDRFALVGHDRGALVAVRAGLDHPEAVTQLGILDVLPTLDMWEVLHGVRAAVAWHLYLMAQPAGLPERMIAAVADEFFASFLDAWGADEQVMPADVRQHYLDASRAAVPSIVADYRASAGVDLEHDLADREDGTRLAMPVASLAQDWGGRLGFDPEAIWRAWADDFEFHAIEAGHFMAESHPSDVVDFVRKLIRRERRRAPAGTS